MLYDHLATARTTNRYEYSLQRFSLYFLTGGKKKTKNRQQYSTVGSPLGSKLIKLPTGTFYCWRQNAYFLTWNILRPEARRRGPSRLTMTSKGIIPNNFSLRTTPKVKISKLMIKKFDNKSRVLTILYAVLTH